MRIGCDGEEEEKNTSLVAPGALTHHLQHLTTCLIQNGQQGLEKGQTVGNWTL